MCQGKGIKLADGVLMGDYTPRARSKKIRSTAKSAAYFGYAAMPNKAINSGRIADSFVEWHLAGGAQPLAIGMNEGVCLAVEADQQRIQRL